MKKFMLSLILLFLISVGYAENTASFEITCTPIVTYSIKISTPAGGISFGTRELGQSFVHSTSVTVKNDGNVSADWTLKANYLTAWTLGETLTDNGSDRAVLAAIFNSTPTVTTDYNDNDVLLPTEKNADGTNFAGYGQHDNGNNVTANSTRNLWIYIKTPTVTTVENEQRFRIEIKAYPANKF